MSCYGHQRYHEVWKEGSLVCGSLVRLKSLMELELLLMGYNHRLNYLLHNLFHLPILGSTKLICYQPSEIREDMTHVELSVRIVDQKE